MLRHDECGLFHYTCLVSFVAVIAAWAQPTASAQLTEYVRGSSLLNTWGTSGVQTVARWPSGVHRLSFQVDSNGQIHKSQERYTNTAGSIDAASCVCQGTLCEAFIYGTGTFHYRSQNLGGKASRWEIMPNIHAKAISACDIGGTAHYFFVHKDVDEHFYLASVVHGNLFVANHARLAEDAKDIAVLATSSEQVYACMISASGKNVHAVRYSNGEWSEAKELASPGSVVRLLFGYEDSTLAEPRCDDYFASGVPVEYPLATQPEADRFLLAFLNAFGDEGLGVLHDALGKTVHNVWKWNGEDFRSAERHVCSRVARVHPTMRKVNEVIRAALAGHRDLLRLEVMQRTVDNKRENLLSAIDASYQDAISELDGEGDEEEAKQEAEEQSETDEVAKCMERKSKERGHDPENYRWACYVDVWIAKVVERFVEGVAERCGIEWERAVGKPVKEWLREMGQDTEEAAKRFGRDLDAARLKAGEDAADELGRAWEEVKRRLPNIKIGG